jgi:hypothetical protein
MTIRALWGVAVASPSGGSVHTLARYAVLTVGLLASVAYALEPLPESPKLVGSTPGQFAVSPSGAATYSPGIAGMQPRLSLEYNSQAGNGIMGMGWSLAGLSAITRCPQTMAQDGVRGAVNYNNADRFCLDGQRLVLVEANGGTVADQTINYGAAGTQYRTEIESFSKITADGVAGSGPESFTVKTKAGLTMEYGNPGTAVVSANARIEAQGKNAVKVWALNKVTDIKGNSMSFAYNEDNANGEFNLSSISYGGNSVQLVYGTRTDVQTGYQVDSKITSSRRLEGIKALIGINQVKDYRLSYAAQATALDNSKLLTMTECDGLGICLPSITASWPPATSPVFTAQDFGKGGSTSVGYWGGYSGASSQSFHFTGDFNGDGKTDFMFWGTGGWNVLLATETGFAPVQMWGTGNSLGYWDGYSGTSSQPFHFTGDFNGDGKTDFMFWGKDALGKYGWNVLLSTGTTFAPVQARGTGGGLGYWSGYANTTKQSFHFAADFNGDGLTDFMYWSTGTGTDGWNVLISTSTGFLPNQVWGRGGGVGYFSSELLGFGNGGSQSFQHIGDFNGDGKMDFMYWGLLGWNVLLSTGSGFLPNQYWETGGGFGYWDGYAGTSSQPFHFAADFNGDGLTDFMYWGKDALGKSGWNVLLSTGTRFAPVQAWGTGDATGYWTYYNLPICAGSNCLAYINGVQVTGSSQSFHHLGDFNGDGKADFMYWTPNGWEVLLSNGTKFNTVQVLGTAGGAGRWPGFLSASSQAFHQIGDFNGDGKLDLMYWTDRWNVLKNNFVSDRVGIFSNESVKTAVEYKSLSTDAPYIKNTAAIYPKVDLQIPLYVVNQTITPNGVSGNNSISYQYRGLQAEQGTGRGMLGFEFVEIWDRASGIKTWTSYKQDWPYIGMPLSISTSYSPQVGTNVLIKHTANDYGCKIPFNATTCNLAVNCNDSTNSITCKSASSSRYFPHLTKSVEYSQNISGTNVFSMTTQALPTLTSDYEYNLNPGDTQLWGDPTRITVSTSDGSSKVTTNQYKVADTSNWILGRLQRASVTSTTPVANIGAAALPTGTIDTPPPIPLTPAEITTRMAAILQLLLADD